jgi:hypothetical protein
LSKHPEFDLNLSTVESMARLANCEITSMTSFLGGIVAQEAIKSIGKYTPLK